MIVNYSNQEILIREKSIFLAGPTSRDCSLTCWRKEAICILSKIGYDGVVYPSSSDVIGLGRMNSKETLIVAKVKVGLGPVLRHITLPVLIGIEGAGVYIEIRVEFLDCYAQSPCLK